MNSIYVITISDGEYDCYQTRVFCAADSEDDAKSIVEQLTALAKYKNTGHIGFYRKWNSTHKMPQVNEKIANSPELFEKYKKDCKKFFQAQNEAMEEYRKMKEAATTMSELAQKALLLVDKIDPDWTSVGFAYSNIDIVR